MTLGDIKIKKAIHLGVYLWDDRGTHGKNNSRNRPPPILSEILSFKKQNYWVSIVCPGTKLITRKRVIRPSYHKYPHVAFDKTVELESEGKNQLQKRIKFRRLAPYNPYRIFNYCCQVG